MTTMPEETVDKLMVELGVDDEDFAVKQIEAGSEGTVLETLVQSARDIVFTIYQRTLDACWKLIQQAFRTLIPQMFLRYATGSWLDEFALDRSLQRFLGQYTILTLSCTKQAGSELTIYQGSVFYIVEQSPRRYQLVSRVDIAEEVTEFEIDVEAIAPIDGEWIFSEAYNAPVGLTWDSEDALPIDSISFDKTEYVQSGADPEEDEDLRSRILALESLKNIELGVFGYYETLLKTVSQVSYANLDDVDDSTGTMYFSLYGTSGTLGQGVIDEAQAVFDAGKMRTDKGVLAAAESENLDVTINRTGGGTETEVINAVDSFFKTDGRGIDFEASMLYDALADQWPQMIVRISPQNAVLPAGKYFAPITTVLDIV